MSIEALWTTIFADGNDIAHFSGVVILHGGHVYGGDNNYHYHGHYRFDGEQLALSLTASHFHGGRNPIAGDRDAFTLDLEGTPGEERMDLAGNLDHNPDAGVTVHMRRAAELPDSGPSLV